MDTTKPVFNVVSDEVLVYLGTEFSADAEMNLLFAEDNNDKNVTERITYVGEVDPKRAGVYPVEYTVSDASGNTASTTITYRVTDSLDEYVSYLYKRTIDFYWGKYFITDNDQTVTNYDSAVYYFFTNNGQQQFERACGLAENTDDTAGGIQLVKTDDQIYMYDQEKIVVNNYLATTLTKAYQKGIYLRFYAVASYGNGIETIMTQDSLFSLKRVEGKWYVDNFALPN
ncbi:hypothetical protein SDC9_112319 [bioreactor metagenome]|uniref:Pesticidal crystal protein Cry22Aa Ig-like domain-containing protein n=1 Tax=bioreactor metagenome TaxID=1076179 RepID=A0A645BQC1_9ZZZZ